jgi:hypothetical protein
MRRKIEKLRDACRLIVLSMVDILFSSACFESTMRSAWQQEGFELTEHRSIQFQRQHCASEEHTEKNQYSKTLPNVKGDLDFSEIPKWKFRDRINPIGIRQG